MTVPADIRDQAYKLFTQEVPDLLQAIESDLLTLTQERSPAKIHNLMRNSHSIKGGAAGLGLEAITALAHRLENIFKALYSETLEIDTELESQLLQAYDCLRLPLVQQVVAGQFDAEQALAAAEPIFARIEERLGDILRDIDKYDIPTSAQLGVDMTLSILEIDVSEQLERLSAAIATGQSQHLEAELRSRTEVFVELAEILNKPGLGVIAEVVLQAVDAHPDQVSQIAQLALVNFQTYREALLASNGAYEAKPVPELLALASDRSNPTGPYDEISPPASFPPESEAIDPVVVVDGELAHDDEPLVTEKIVVEEMLGELLNEAAASNGFGADSLSLIIETLKEVQQQTGEPSPPAAAQGPSELVVRSLANSSRLLPLHNSPEAVSQFLPPAESLRQISAKIHQDEIPLAPNATVRVDSDQLEQMNNLVNESVIKRSGLSLQNEQVQKTVRELLSRVAAVEQIAAQLRKVSDRTLIPNSRQGYRTPLDPEHWLKDSTTQANFDALEMDSYGTLHSLLQRLLEDMIQLRESADDIALFTRQSDRKLAELRKSLTQLQDDFMWVRMLPIGEVLNRFPRILRDLSVTYQKPVKLRLSGTEVLVDKAIIERIYDPLLHLLRNAFDHGIEPAEIRRQQGKPEQGLIEVKVYHGGGQTIIEVRDDGQGLNLERIGRRAIELGILTPQQLMNVSGDRLFNLIFETGFSTASQVSELSGRGVGLDVVRTQLSYLKGTISVTSQPGNGTTFTLRLPLTLTSDKLLVCLSGFTALALPSDGIKEILAPRADQVVKIGEQAFLQWRNEVVPIYKLSNLLEYAGPVPDVSPLGAMSTKFSSPDADSSLAEPAETRPLLVIHWGQKFAALEVDQLITEQKLVIKPFGAIIAPPTCIYGCTILGDGSVVPVVDGAALLDESLERNARTRRLPVFPTPEREAGSRYSRPYSDFIQEAGATQPPMFPKVLVVDDAVALRQTLALTLESVGYRVLQAGDGWEAVRQLQFNPDVGLVISDIEMPNMNGFDFMNYRRQDPKIQAIPLVILTSRSNDKHRRLAMHLGATAYFTKPYIEKEFLEAIKTVLNTQVMAQ